MASRAFLALLACFMAALTAYVGKDLREMEFTRSPGADVLVLDLPENRSLIHHPPALHARIPYSDIEAIETRQEVYVSQFMGMMQRPYVLHRKNDQLIFLFEERAIGSQLEVNYFSKLVADIVARAGVPLRDLGMAEGKGGVLGVWARLSWTGPRRLFRKNMRGSSRVGSRSPACSLFRSSSSPSSCG